MFSSSQQQQQQEAYFQKQLILSEQLKTFSEIQYQQPQYTQQVLSYNLNNFQSSQPCQQNPRPPMNKVESSFYAHQAAYRSKQGRTFTNSHHRVKNPTTNNSDNNKQPAVTLKWAEKDSKLAITGKKNFK